MTHAFFKALLFLGAGSVIHGVGGEQDMRNMGGLRKYMPVTFWVMVIATCAISGIPGFAGFFSKDEILWQSFSSPHGHWALWAVGVTTAFITSFYMFRLIFMTFAGEYRGPLGATPVSHEPQPQGTEGSTEHAQHTHQVPIGGQQTVAHAPTTDSSEHHGTPHESPWVMLAPLVVLAVLSVVGGWIGIGQRFENFLTPVVGQAQSAPESPATGVEVATGHESAAENPAEKTTENVLMATSIFLAFAGLGLAWLLYVKRRDLPDKISASLGGIYEAVLHKYYVDEIYRAAIISPLIQGSTKLLWRGVDAGLIDGSVNNAADGARHLSDGMRRMQSGYIRSYAGWVAAGAALVVIYMIWMGTR
jgi:NADH-quinone oxidoreductase subunit L